MKTSTVEIEFSGNTLFVTRDGVLKKFELEKISRKLLNASTEERMIFRISPSGYGVHWPLLDEDISIHALWQENKLLKAS